MLSIRYRKVGLSLIPWAVTHFPPELQRIPVNVDSILKRDVASYCNPQMLILPAFANYKSLYQRAPDYVTIIVTRFQDVVTVCRVTWLLAQT
jgi:hypothetical protein